jgi:hypothetical protein
MYYLVYYNKDFNYYKIIGSGNDKQKSIIQSKNFILYYLRTPHILNYTNNSIYTLEFEIDLKYLLQNNKLIYEQSIMEESFSFYFISKNHVKLLNKYNLLNKDIIHNNILFSEDKKIAEFILDSKLYNFNIDTIKYPLLKLEYNTNFNKLKFRSKSI